MNGIFFHFRDRGFALAEAVADALADAEAAVSSAFLERHNRKTTVRHDEKLRSFGVHVPGA